MYILATCWTVRVSNPGGGRDFPHLSRPALGLTQPLVQWVRVFPEGKEKAWRDAFTLKNPTASAGFEPANLGTKGQHATSRPPKPLYFLYDDLIMT